MVFEGGREPFGWRTKRFPSPSSSPHPSQTRFAMEDDGWLPVAKLPLLMVPRKNVEPDLCWSGFLFFSLFFFPSFFSFAGSIRWTGGHKKGQPYDCPFLWLWGKRMGKRSNRMPVGCTRSSWMLQAARALLPLGEAFHVRKRDTPCLLKGTDAAAPRGSPAIWSRGPS